MCYCVLRLKTAWYPRADRQLRLKTGFVESVTFVLLGEWLHGQENNSYLSKILNNVPQQGWLYIGGRQNNYFSKMFVLQEECLGRRENNSISLRNLCCNKGGYIQVGGKTTYFQRCLCYKESV